MVGRDRAGAMVALYELATTFGALSARAKVGLPSPSSPFRLDSCGGGDVGG